MIKSIAIEGFKSLEKVAIKLGSINIFIGANGSGKSNFLEAIRILQGIGYGFAIDEIFNGKPKSANCDIWEPIRGGSRKADFVRRNNEDSSTVEKEMGATRIVPFQEVPKLVKIVEKYPLGELFAEGWFEGGVI